MLVILPILNFSKKSTRIPFLHNVIFYLNMKIKYGAVYFGCHSLLISHRCVKTLSALLVRTKLQSNFAFFPIISRFLALYFICYMFFRHNVAVLSIQIVFMLAFCILFQTLILITHFTFLVRSCQTESNTYKQTTIVNVTKQTVKVKARGSHQVRLGRGSDECTAECSVANSITQ